VSGFRQVLSGSDRCLHAGPVAIPRGGPCSASVRRRRASFRRGRRDPRWASNPVQQKRHDFGAAGADSAPKEVTSISVRCRYVAASREERSSGLGVPRLTCVRKRGAVVVIAGVGVGALGHKEPYQLRVTSGRGLVKWRPPLLIPGIDHRTRSQQRGGDVWPVTKDREVEMDASSVIANGRATDGRPAGGAGLRDYWTPSFPVILASGSSSGASSPRRRSISSRAARMVPAASIAPSMHRSRTKQALLCSGSSS